MRRRAGPRRRRRELGRPRRRWPSSGAGSASRHSPASPAWSAPRPIQNVGAYGQEVSQTVGLGAGLGPHAPRRPHLRQRRLRVRLPHLALQGRPGPARRPRRHLPAPARRPRHARCSTPSWPAPSASSSARGAPLAEVREAVLALRRSKGMVLDPADHDTWSAGSFFTNPVVDAARRARRTRPRWPQPDGSGEDQRGLADRARRLRARGTAPAGSALSDQAHPRAHQPRRRRPPSELLALAREVRDGVEPAYGIRLVTEPVLVGCAL